MLIEIHMVQNHSPSNLNRDELGAPKTAYFGGVMRARISSQCLKRSIRNPGNPEDIHNRQPGLFARALHGHVGLRTKFFPWLVQKELENSAIPEDERFRVVLAAQRIALSKEKTKGDAGYDAESDARPKTPQLIHLGPGYARLFVEKLVDARTRRKDVYDFFLHPIVTFKELVRAYLENSTLDEKVKEKIVKTSWVIAKCRMDELLNATGQESDLDPASPLKANQPDNETAKAIAEGLEELYLGENEQKFKDITKPASKEEKGIIKDEEPHKPSGMHDFMNSLKPANLFDAVDIALFGRMTTSDAFDDVEAAMQTAHAISTHAVVNEVDYFAAVDDLGQSGGGAGHIDETLFNSACFYKYFSLDWDQLIRNLAGPEPKIDKDAQAYATYVSEIKPRAEQLAACTLGHFLEAAAMTSPKGKQNSFASNCEPCGILVEIKKDRKIPTSYANAFAEPVERVGRPDEDAADEKSLEGRSVAALAEHVHSLRMAYGIDSKVLWYSPRLWRFPFQYYVRSDDGKRNHAEWVTKSRYSVLGGGHDENGKPTGLIAAVLDEVCGLQWEQISNTTAPPMNGATS